MEPLTPKVIKKNSMIKIKKIVKFCQYIKNQTKTYIII